MQPGVKSVLAIVAGIFVGMSVNMGIIMISGKVIPPPEGIDTTTAEGLRAAIPLFEPRHFLMPFLAHALGTLAGAFVAAWWAPARQMIFAMIIGGWFLLGGIANVMMLPSPLWFTVLDLAAAYLPMAILGGFIASLVRKK
jgi:hypothetical protein